MLRVGDVAPDFTAETDGGGSVRLSDLRGKRVVLYFYPKNHTPGCTVEACSFRDAAKEFEAKNAVVLGASPDTAKSHHRFKAKHKLPFPLVSDRDHAIAEAFGVWREKKLFGRKYMGMVRSTFVIDEEGRIDAAFDRVKVLGHVSEVLACL